MAPKLRTKTSSTGRDFLIEKTTKPNEAASIYYCKYDVVIINFVLLSVVTADVPFSYICENLKDFPIVFFMIAVAAIFMFKS